MLKRIGVQAVITNDEEEIRRSSKMILPGVGHFKKGMSNLNDTGLRKILDYEVLELKKPILGICLGAQLMTLHSEEGDIEGLGWINGKTVRFRTENLPDLKVPHMGWSDVNFLDKNPVWVNLPEDPRFYHVHSYHFEMNEQSDVSAISHYGYDFVSAFRKDNIYGTQFHPEKSHKYGMSLLENFTLI